MPKEDGEIKELSKKLAQNPDSMVFVQLADAYRRSGDLERSVEVCLQGLERHPTYATARVILGRDYLDLNKLDEADAEFRRIEAVDSENILAHRMLGQIALRKGLFAEAISRQQRVLALDPDDNTAQDLLQQALFQAKQHENGVKEPAVSGSVSVPSASALPETQEHAQALKIADIYIKKRAWPQAAEVVREILLQAPHFSPALEKSKEIAALMAGGGDEKKAGLTKAEEEAKRKADEEAKRKAEEEAKRKAEEEAKRKAEEEAKRKAEEEAKRKAEEEAKRKAEEEAKRKAEEEAKRKAEEEAKRKADEETKRKAEEEAERKAVEEAERKAEEETKRKAEEETKRKAEEETKRKAEEEAERKAEEKAERKAEEEAERKAEEKAERKAEEEAKRKAEEEAKRKAEEEAKRKAEEEAKRKAEEEAKRKAEEEAKRKAEEEAKRKAEEEAKRKAEEEALDNGSASSKFSAADILAVMGGSAEDLIENEAAFGSSKSTASEIAQRPDLIGDFIRSQSIEISLLLDQRGLLIEHFMAVAGGDATALGQAAMAVYQNTAKAMRNSSFGGLKQIMISGEDERQILLLALRAGVLVAVTGRNTNVGLLRIAVHDLMKRA